MDDVSDLTTSSGSDDGSSTESSGNSSGERTSIRVEGTYGVTTYPPDSACKFCGDVAEGVVVGKSRVSGERGALVGSKPICTEHRRHFEADDSVNFEAFEYRTF